MLAETSHSPHNPIEKKEHDRLGRQTLAEGLAKVVLANYQYQPGYTVAVYGGWGSGKTSVMNMVEEALKAQAKEANNKAPIIVKFNPWFYGHTKQLDTLFLDALFQAIETHLLEEPPNWDNLDERWDKFQETLYLFGIKIQFLFFFALVVYPKLIIQILEQILGFLEGYYLHLLCLCVLSLTFKGVRERLNYFIKIGGSFSKDMKAFEALVKPTMEHFELKNLTWLSNVLINQLPPETELTKKINQHLARLDTPVVVFLDDLDRLTNEEVLTVFRLMREVANFKNVVYIVGIDKDQTARAIEDQQNCTDGMVYLEKIIHYSIDLIPADYWAYSYFQEKIVEGLKTNEHKEAFEYNYRDAFYQPIDEKERDENNRTVLINGIFTALKTPRAMVQLLQTVHSELNVQKDDVGAFDYFLITFLRLYSHNVYKLLLKNFNNTEEMIKDINTLNTNVEITTLDKKIVDFLLSEPPYVTALASEYVELKRYIHDPMPYLELKPSNARLNASDNLKAIAPKWQVYPLVLSFMIDEMKQKQDFNIALQIINILKEDKLHRNISIKDITNRQQYENEHLKFLFTYRRLVYEIEVLQPKPSQTQREELSIALKTFVLENKNFNLLNEFLKGETAQMATVVGQDCLYELLNRFIIKAPNHLKFEQRTFAFLPEYFNKYKISEDTKKRWKEVITNECIQNITPWHKNSGSEKDYKPLHRILRSIYFWNFPLDPYGFISQFLDFDNPIIRERLEAIAQWEDPIVREQLHNQPEYVSLAALLRKVKAKHGGTQPPEH